MNLVEALRGILPEDRIRSRVIDRYSFARDASFYRLIPQVVVQPQSEAEIKDLFQLSHQTRTPLVFRAAGTSLSGQAITDGILVELSQHWQGFHFEESSATIELQPALIGGQVNRRLAPLGRKIGPDPASLDAAMVGGIVANNASEMCCGVKDNAYHTLDTIRFILPNGKLYDTMDPKADEQLQDQDSQIYKGLLKLKKQIMKNQMLLDRIRDKYSRKNTLGYSLNAFIDFERPIDILAHLLVGSEGTLGFISKVRLRTLADKQFKAAALLSSSLTDTSRYLIASSIFPIRS